MDHATCLVHLLATHFVTSLFPLTVRLVPLITEVGRMVVRFSRAELTSQACHQFEIQLQNRLTRLRLRPTSLATIDDNHSGSR
jgi:hypothetical protein